MATPIPPRLEMTLLDEAYVVCRLDPGDAIPSWCDGPGLVSITRTKDELSVVCPVDRLPPDVARVERGWRCLRFHGPIDFAQTGVLAAAAGPLAAAGVGIFAIATFDTDYVLVRESQLDQAVAALRDAGHQVATS